MGMDCSRKTLSQTLSCFRITMRTRLLFEISWGQQSSGAPVFIAECGPFCAMQARFEFDVASSEDLVVNVKPRVVPCVFLV